MIEIPQNQSDWESGGGVFTSWVTETEEDTAAAVDTILDTGTIALD